LESWLAVLKRLAKLVLTTCLPACRMPLLQDMGFAPLRYGVSERYCACMEVIARKIAA